MGIDVGEPDGGVRNELVEVLHDRLLGQDRQILEWSFAKSLVETSGEGGAGVSAPPRQSEFRVPQVEDASTGPVGAACGAAPKPSA